MPPSLDRRALLATGTGLLASLTGCSALTDADATTAATHTATRVPDTEWSSPPPEPPRALAVHVGGLARVVLKATAEWNENALDHGAPFDARLADGFAARHGFEPTGEASNPPFDVAPATAGEEGVAAALAAETVDLGGTAPAHPGEVYAGDPDEGRFTPHPVAVGGWKVVLSPALAEAGVTELTAETVRRLFSGEVGNWREVGGPDREPYVVGAATGTPNRPVREYFFQNRPQTGVDVRFGKPSSRLEVVGRRDDAVTLVEAGSPTRDLPVPSLTVAGTSYRPAEDGYPVTYPVALYSWDEPDPREAAFLEFLRSTYGQGAYVGYDRDLLALDGG
jgi:phosphate transport system substrate-binding protein